VLLFETIFYVGNIYEKQGKIMYDHGMISSFY